MQAPDLSSLPTVARGDASYSPSDLRAAQQAEFGLAKAQAGALGRSGIRGLRSELSGRGILGSGAEIQGTVDQLRSTLQPLSDLNAAHLRESYGAAERERDRAEARADTEFQGGIAQRGQDLSAQGLRASLYEGEANRAAREAEARYQGEIAQRSQNISAQQSLDSLKAALMQSGYQGEITQRGQDLSASAADADRTLSSQRLSVDALSRILSALATSAA